MSRLRYPDEYWAERAAYMRELGQQIGANDMRYPDPTYERRLERRAQRASVDRAAAAAAHSPPTLIWSQTRGPEVHVGTAIRLAPNEVISIDGGQTVRLLGFVGFRRGHNVWRCELIEAAS